MSTAKAQAAFIRLQHYTATLGLSAEQAKQAFETMQTLQEPVFLPKCNLPKVWAPGSTAPIKRGRKRERKTRN